MNSGVLILQNKFGKEAVDKIVLMNQKKLKRKIIELDTKLKEQVES